MKRIYTLLILLLSVCTLAQAQVVDPEDPSEKSGMATMKRRDKATKQEEKINTKNADWYTSTVYMFAVSSQFGDSVVYVSELMPVENVQLTKKYDYLKFRSEFTYYFKQYLADNYGCEKQTCAVFFDKNKKKLNKRYDKVMKRYKADKAKKVNIIPQSGFTFKLPEYPNLAQ